MGRLIDLFYNRYNYTDFHELNMDWLISSVKELLIAVDSLDSWKAEHEKEYLELKKLYDDIISGNFPEAMYLSLHTWVVENSQSIISDIIKSVFFTLEDGYFVAHIPDSWSEIIFGTSGLDDFPADVDFGHLTLSY